MTAWPAALTVVMTWDTELMYTYGQAMGREQYGKGSNVMLGPGVNLARLPWNGRNLFVRASPLFPFPFFPPLSFLSLPFLSSPSSPLPPRGL